MAEDVEPTSNQPLKHTLGQPEQKRSVVENCGTIELWFTMD